MRVGKAEKSFKKFLVETLRSDLSSSPTHLVPLLSQMREDPVSRLGVVSPWSKSGLAQNWKKEEAKFGKVKRKRMLLYTETQKETLRHKG